MRIQAITCKRGDCLPLLVREAAEMKHPLFFAAHCCEKDTLPLEVPQYVVGTILYDTIGRAVFRIEGRQLIAVPHTRQGGVLSLGQSALMLRALVDMESGIEMYYTARVGFALAWISLSDKAAQGLRQDTAGPLLAELVRQSVPLCHEMGFLIPDDPQTLKSLVMELALGQGYDLIISTGGTGVAPRDRTPESLLPLFDRRLQGLEIAMMSAALEKTPMAGLSRAVAGTLGRSIVLTLPGSPKAVRENLTTILPALVHGLEKLHGDPTDCANL